MKKFIVFLAVFSALVLGAGQAFAALPVTTPERNNCLPSTPPYVKIITPNGGESYRAGQQVLVRWKSCNLPLSATIRLNLNQITTGSAYGLVDTVNDGSELVTIPTPYYFSVLVFGNNFKMLASWLQNPSVYDWSDNLFEIYK
jgi:hypothetical protein